ncbi:MAG: DUF3786 domain-containing protein [Desulfobacula sp.]|nr:DUF3786 domain-containing protein [Desulfobacula sp.]
MGKDTIDKTIFSDLKACDPEDVLLRTNCRFNKAENQYFVNIWGYDYCVDLNQYEVKPQKAGLTTYHDFLYLFILYYLMKSKNIKPLGEWISEKDIPGGAAFFRGPHTVPGDVITNQFGNDMDSFKQRCKKLNGISLDMADAAFMFQVTPTIPVAVLYYFADEDFPCEAKLLFDKTIGLHLPLDIVFALAVEICNTIGTN